MPRAGVPFFLAIVCRRASIASEVERGYARENFPTGPKPAMKTSLTAAIVCCCLLGCAANATSASTAEPAAATLADRQGMSVVRLQRLTKFMNNVVVAGDYLGAVTLVARDGHIIDQRAHGHRNLGKTSAMLPDTIFRIYSMTKPITSVAALMLMEEGKLSLEDPVSKYLPAFSVMQVQVGGTVAVPQLRPAVRPITIRHLLTHTAGFATGGENLEAVKRFNSVDLHKSLNLKAYVEYVAKQPLAADPGTRFNYDGVPLEVLSHLIEVVAGIPFDLFLARYLLGPLRMVDSGFSVPFEKRQRVADLASTDQAGKLVLATPRHAKFPGEMLNPYPSGAGGLYSTAIDFLRFSQMLLNGGELDGVTILGRKSVELMMMNHLTHLTPPVNAFNPAEGFGLGGWVVLDVARRGRPGSVGQFGWSGAASTYFTIDPKEKLIAILMMQYLPTNSPNDAPKISTQFYNLVYQSIVK